MAEVPEYASAVSKYCLSSLSEAEVASLHCMRVIFWGLFLLIRKSFEYSFRAFTFDVQKKTLYLKL